MTDNEADCGKCRFQRNDGESRCHRYPPQAQTHSFHRDHTVESWPKVSLSWWCGEFQPKPNGARP